LSSSGLLIFTITTAAAFRQWWWSSHWTSSQPLPNWNQKNHFSKMVSFCITYEQITRNHF